VRKKSYGFSFSWKRALGTSGAKTRLSRTLGLPLTRSGLERKIGRGMTRGCSTYVVCVLAAIGAVVWALQR
jgi:hypothetical protein